jgi:hypothetical protein
MMSTLQFKKGETVERLKALSVIPLFVELEHDKESVHSRLPRYNSPPQQSKLSHLNATCTTPHLSLFPQPIQDYVRSLLDDKKEEPTLMYNIVVSLYILFLDGKEEENGLVKRILASVRADEDEDEDDNYNSKAHIRRSYKLLERDDSRITFEQWERFITAVSQQLHVVWTEHPLHSYASQQVPNLTQEELEVVLRILNIPQKSKSKSTLWVMKQIQDSCCSTQSRPYGVILDHDANQSFDYAHSCLPTAQIELELPSRPSGPALVALTARYDLARDAPVTISYIPDDESVERREDMVQRRTGHSCGCLRCIYEANPHHQLAGATGTLHSQQAIQLGHFYMASELLEKAEPLYDYAATKKESNDPDLWHARGALELSRGNFLRAQRIWQQAAMNTQSISTACQQHAGMRLQIAKLNAYGYLRPPKSTSTADSTARNILTWKSPVPDADAFVTNLLDAATCRQVIDWAESGEWTQQRHYAVPTNDVAVHTVPPLLAWFNNWLEQHVCPLLARQFPTTEANHFYVHDAFCVRYQAGAASNHLPVHTDESTHSFVLALNDKDDYQGGGTYFYNYDTTIRLQAGEILSFRGDCLSHGGEALVQGTRYILAGFLYYDDDGKERDDQHGSKRPSSEITNLLQESKQEKAGFTFNFATT